MLLASKRRTSLQTGPQEGEGTLGRRWQSEVCVLRLEAVIHCGSHCLGSKDSYTYILSLLLYIIMDNFLFKGPSELSFFNVVIFKAVNLCIKKEQAMGFQFLWI